MTSLEKHKALESISEALDNDINALFEGHDLDTNQATEFRKERVYQRVMKHINNQRKSYAWMKVAAVLLPFLFLNATCWFYFNSEHTPNYKEIYVPCGERMTVLLSDGTKVFLNADTRLTYPEQFSSKTRKVAVEGEAYFEVSKNKHKPFVVDVDDMQIKVLGTSFNVNAYANEGKIVTTLDEGSVKILNKRNQSFEYTMVPGDMASFEKETGTCIIEKNANYKDQSMWLKDILILDDTPMKDVLKKLARKYNVEFVVDNPTIYTYTYTLRSEKESLQEILDDMECITPIKCHREKNSAKIYIELR